MHGDLPDLAHHAPAGVDELVIEALGDLSEALETVERARGHLYVFHQLTGTAGYWASFRSLEREAREHLVAGRQHLHEARMKQQRRTVGQPGHEATPVEVTEN